MSKIYEPFFVSYSLREFKDFCAVFASQMQHVVETRRSFYERFTFSNLPVCCTLNKVMTRATFKSYAFRIWSAGSPPLSQVITLRLTFR